MIQTWRTHAMLIKRLERQRLLLVLRKQVAWQVDQEFERLPMRWWMGLIWMFSRNWRGRS